MSWRDVGGSCRGNMEGEYDLIKNFVLAYHGPHGTATGTYCLGIKIGLR